MVGVVGALGPRVLPLEEVRAVADPGAAFLNVNTREDRERAEAWLRRRASAGA